MNQATLFLFVLDLALILGLLLLYLVKAAGKNNKEQATTHIPVRENPGPLRAKRISEKIFGLESAYVSLLNQVKMSNDRINSLEKGFKATPSIEGADTELILLKDKVSKLHRFKTDASLELAVIKELLGELKCLLAQDSPEESRKLIKKIDSLHSQAKTLETKL